MAENLREIVLDVLMEHEKEGTYLNKLIKATLDKYDYLDSRDKAFIKTLSEGVIERKITLDFYIDSVSKVKTNKQKPLIRNLLRMGAYQIFFMDKIPASAICNEAVKLAKKRHFDNLSGFVNGVLRTLIRENADLQNKEKSLSVAYSFPEWITVFFEHSYGRDKACDILAGLLEKHDTTLHPVDDEAAGIVLKELETIGAEFEINKYCEKLISVKGIDNMAALKSYAEGLFFVQDASSALAVKNAKIKEGDTVIDVCAAPGGKSMAASLFAGSTGRIYSFDIGDNKISRINENIERMKALNISAESVDAVFGKEELFGKADVVIADLPCSGLGVIGKKSDIKYRVTKEDLEALSVLQRKILDTSVKYLKKGGTILYSTCTINHTENEANAEYLVKKGFKKIDEKQFFPDKYIDGFYYCILKDDRH